MTLCETDPSFCDLSRTGKDRRAKKEIQKLGDMDPWPRCRRRQRFYCCTWRFKLLCANKPVCNSRRDIDEPRRVHRLRTQEYKVRPFEATKDCTGCMEYLKMVAVGLSRADRSRFTRLSASAVRGFWPGSAPGRIKHVRSVLVDTSSEGDDACARLCIQRAP